MNPIAAKINVAEAPKPSITQALAQEAPKAPAPAPNPFSARN